MGKETLWYKNEYKFSLENYHEPTTSLCSQRFDPRTLYKPPLVTPSFHLILYFLHCWVLGGQGDGISLVLLVFVAFCMMIRMTVS
jgi:hypothetical protein